MTTVDSHAILHVFLCTWFPNFSVIVLRKNISFSAFKFLVCARTGNSNFIDAVFGKDSSFGAGDTFGDDNVFGDRGTFGPGSK